MVSLSDKELSKRLSDAVKRYNRIVKRAEKSGIPKVRLPELVKASDIRKTHVLRRDLEKEIKRLENFSRDSMERVEINKSFKAPRWMIDYYSKNRKLAINFFEKELRRVEKRTEKYPGEGDYEDVIRAKLGVLKRDLKDLDERAFRNAIISINQFNESPSVAKNHYRGFLQVVEIVMDTLGYSDEEKNKFFKKFEVLTPSQFLYLYDNNNLISRVYELYFGKDVNGEIQLNTDDGTAEDLINSLIEDVDSSILDALENAD